jgi:hypothetical protein
MTTTDGVELSALLSHPDWAGVRGLAALGHARTISSALLVRDVAAVPAPHTGCLLAVLYSDDRDDWRLDSMLNRARTARAAALMVEGHAPLRRSTTALAERFGLPVVGAVDVIAAHEAAGRLLARSRLVTADLVLRVLAATRRAGPSVDEAVAAVATAVGRPAGVVDSHGALLSGALEVDATALAAALGRESPRDPQVREVTLPGGALLVAGPIHSAATKPWLVVVVPDPVSTERPALQAALGAASPAIEQRLAETRLAIERDARQRTALLGEILQGEVSGTSRRRALDLGWQLDGWHTGVGIGVPADTDTTGRRAEVVAALAAEGLHSQVVEHGDGYAAWTTSEVEPSPERVQQQAAALRRVQRHLSGTLGTHIGVGRAHPGAGGLAQTLSEAADAARLARGRVHTGRFLHVDRLGLAQLLLAWTRTDTFQPAAQALLAPLRGQPGHLVETLAAYLDAESSIAETAAVLGVHRNTVAARIRRIQTLIGVDLSDPDDRLALHLACRTSIAGESQ